MLSLKNLNFSYREPLLESISLEIRPGEIHALLGKNGAGKSTLLNLIIGHLEADGGEVILNNRPLKNHSSRSRVEHIGFVSQSNSVPFNMNVKDFVLMGKAAGKPGWYVPNAEDMEQTDAVLQRIGMYHKKDADVRKISAGELQLSTIARCLNQNPQLLILDEPASHLDPANSAELIRFLKSLSQEGYGVFYTSHDPLGTALHADRVSMLHNRAIFQSGTPEAVLTRDFLSTVFETSFTGLKYGDRDIYTAY
jgi:iron complex transport system ATP-binding protein